MICIYFLLVVFYSIQSYYINNIMFTGIRMYVSMGSVPIGNTKNYILYCFFFFIIFYTTAPWRS